MNYNHPQWHKWMSDAMAELGVNYEYVKLREKMKEYYVIHRMKKFLKVGEYNKGGEVK